MKVLPKHKNVQTVEVLRQYKSIKITCGNTGDFCIIMGKNSRVIGNIAFNKIKLFHIFKINVRKNVSIEYRYGIIKFEYKNKSNTIYNA
ncbi:MAG: hypothetical protein ACI8WT_001486 [Clostridium sp.]|jgi:hypothetical protein